MAIWTEDLPVSVPGLRAVRWSTDALYSGLKEVYTIGLIERGQLSFFSAGKVWSSSPGWLLVKQPGDLHRDLAHDGPTTYQLVKFPAQVVESAVGKVRVQPQLAPDDARGAPFQRLHAAVRAGAGRLALEVAVAEALAAFGALGDGRCQPTRAVRRAVELLRARLAEPVTLDALAAHADLDKFHLCRAFRAQVGLPPHAYLMQLRVGRAKQLLAAGVRPREVATAVGFYDQSQLHRHFRRIVGTTPGRYADDARPRRVATSRASSPTIR